MIETSDISINSPGASLVALHEPSPDRWPPRRSPLSPRALQEGFRKHMDMTPTEYVRRVRMARAHDMLAQADPQSGVSVAQIAYQWGFTNLGGFARDYRRHCGQLPSTTLRT
ncbi:helix-turn-helix domain-containing protein [Streptomyces sp. NPDC014676]|uniref:helix-turn-helix domain-containing protein n=1 Tax=Streptomyces sp. NPDC014676 TaxID=3364879 RepID=UPI0036FA3D5F